MRIAPCCPQVVIPHSRLKENIAGILKKEGYIAEVGVEGQPIKTIKLKLKYQGKKGVIEGLRRASSPGLRRYVRATAIPRVRGGLGTAILSTSHGVMSGTQARQITWAENCCVLSGDPRLVPPGIHLINICHALENNRSPSRPR
jgi:small subunit ribosomal protein S8